jgi:hypothetical protein
METGRNPTISATLPQQLSAKHSTNTWSPLSKLQHTNQCAERILPINPSTPLPNLNSFTTTYTQQHLVQSFKSNYNLEVKPFPTPHPKQFQQQPFYHNWPTTAISKTEEKQKNRLSRRTI